MTFDRDVPGWERVAAGVLRCRLPVWDCTVGLVTGTGGALLVDAGSSLREGARVRAEAQALAGRRVTHLALTHPHFDHVLGAAVFAGAEVFAAVGPPAAWSAEGLRTDAVRHGLDEREAAGRGARRAGRGPGGRGGRALDSGGGRGGGRGTGGRGGGGRTGGGTGGGGGRRLGGGHAGTAGARGVGRAGPGPRRRPGGGAGERASGAHRAGSRRPDPGRPARRLLRRPGGGVRRPAGRPGRGAVPLAGRPGPAAGPGRCGRAVRARARRGGRRRLRPRPTRRPGGPVRCVAPAVTGGRPVSSAGCASTPPT